MDPISAISLANEGITTCYKVAVTLKEIIEAIKNLREELSPIIERAESTQRILTIIKSLAQRLQEVGLREVKVLLDGKACEDVLNKLFGLTSQIEKAYLHNKVAAGFKWWWKYKDTSVELCNSLAQQEKRLCDTIALLTTHVTLDGLETMMKIEAQINNLPKIISAFQDLTGPATKSAKESSSTPKVSSSRVWPGHTIKEGLDEGYLKDRDRLADAAFSGDWHTVKECISKGENKYGENWANSIRLLRKEKLKSLSHWTPLHQAAYNNAPIEVIHWLVEHGSWCTMRTSRTRFAYQNLTALELAQQLGHTHMYEALSPTIYNTVPHSTLRLVQKQFHDLIKGQLDPQWMEEQCLWLPRLQCLTEMPNGIMWFPLKTHKHDNAAYAFRFDGRDLLVLACNITTPGKSESFRVTEHRSKPVEEALFLHEAPKA